MSHSCQDLFLNLCKPNPFFVSSHYGLKVLANCLVLIKKHSSIDILFMMARHVTEIKLSLQKMRQTLEVVSSELLRISMLCYVMLLN